MVGAGAPVPGRAAVCLGRRRVGTHPIIGRHMTITISADARTISPGRTDAFPGPVARRPRSPPPCVAAAGPSSMHAAAASRRQFGEQRAAGPEPAARRQVRRARQVPAHQDPACAAARPCGSGIGIGRQQRLRVRVRRPLEDVVGRRRSRRSGRGTSPPPGRRCAGPPTGRARRTGRTGPSRTLQILEQVDDAGLDRDVERRHRLVEHEQLAAPARAPGRCRCAGADRRRTPPGSGWRARARGRPAASSSRTRARRCSAATPNARSGSAMMSPTGSRGSSDAIGSWKTTCTSRRSSLRPRRVSAPTSLPRTAIRAVLGRRRARGSA